MGPSERSRSNSFAVIDESQASGILTEVLTENEVYLGGSSLGKGLTKAARHFMKKKLNSMPRPSHFCLPGSMDLVENVERMPLEESFYVLDLGVVVSQVYQWRRFFPRVEPFYAVKCNPDPVVVKTLAILGCNFDCASRNEFRLVHELTADLPRSPEIIFANPCKPRAHLLEAVCKGIKMVTFDNEVEIEKCAKISKSIELVMRIITDDRGSQCRLSSKFGAPRAKWENLLSVANQHGMKVVGVSFHVGSGCRDASRYEAALRDAKEIFGLAETKFGMIMNVVDIGGGFPGETHSLWNPAEHIDDDGEDDETEDGSKDEQENRFMFFTEIAEQVAPVIDRLFPQDSGVRIIAEPGRYLVAAAATLCCSVVSSRLNVIDDNVQTEEINDAEYSQKLNELSREEEFEVVRQRTLSVSMKESDEILQTIQEELADYSKLYASQALTQQEVDVYADKLDLYKEGFDSALDQLGPPDESQRLTQYHTVEGMNYQLVAATVDDAPVDPSGFLTLAAAGEAAVNGVVLQAVADSAPLQDDYAYYISDGVYGAFNNIMFDHATCRPRVLRTKNMEYKRVDDFFGHSSSENGHSSSDEIVSRRRFFASTIFGPTCDSIDVICRSVLLPELKVGDWLYFTNMGAYTMAAASSFNGFTPSEIFYVCSVMPEYFEAMIAGPEAKTTSDVEHKLAFTEEKKEE